MSIGIPADLQQKFGLELARDYEQLVRAVNKIFETGLPRAPSYLVAALPAASSVSAGTMVYVSNESGGAVLAFSDATNWRRVTDRAIVT